MTLPFILLRPCDMSYEQYGNYLMTAMYLHGAYLQLRRLWGWI